jgi:hypothetical protein
MGFMFYCHNSRTCRRKRSQFLFGEESELGIPVHIKQMEDCRGSNCVANLKKGAAAFSLECPPLVTPVGERRELNTAYGKLRHW